MAIDRGSIAQGERQSLADDLATTITIFPSALFVDILPIYPMPWRGINSGPSLANMY